MSFNNLTVNTGTAQGILVDSAGTSDIGVVKLDLSSAGTYGTIWGGGVTGTINSGSISVIAGTIASDTIVGGTLGSILGIGGTVQVSGASAGTNNNIFSGT